MQKAGSREPYLIPAREQIRKTFVQTPHHQPTETIRNSSLEYCVPRLGAADCHPTCLKLNYKLLQCTTTGAACQL